MSYILEALRRAEAERQRGAVPHLHAQPALAGAGDPSDARRPPWGLWLAVAVAALLLVSAAGWFLASDKSVAPPQAKAPVQPPPMVTAVTAVTAPPPAPQVVPATSAVAPVPLGMAPLPPPMPMPMPIPIATPSPPAAAVAVAAKAAAPAAPAVASPPAQATATATTAATASPAASVAAAIPSLAELPAALRQGLPPLSLGGIVHSAQAAQRLVILNGQVLHEGDRPTPELQVEQIRPRSVVLNFRGQAFELAQ